MSYDLELFVEREATRSELSAMVGKLKGLAVEDEETGQFTIVRGAKRAYCFTVDGPFTVDAEDVPEQITAVILNPSHLYTVVVEGSAETSVPHAVRFARKVVTELGGAVLDQQADGVWSRGSSRTTARPVREELTNQ